MEDTELCYRPSGVSASDVPDLDHRIIHRMIYLCVATLLKRVVLLGGPLLYRALV